MCKELKTNCICDRCNRTIQVDPKKIGPVYRKGSYPETWDTIRDYVLCDTCSKAFNTWFTTWMKGGKN